MKIQVVRPESVNSFLSCTKTTSVFGWFVDSFLEAFSFDFPAERFLATYARETLINEWDARGTEISEGLHFLGWTGQEEESWWKIKIIVRQYNLG
jgi:hypothetical protein